MTKYKAYISIDGENFFWVIVENDKVINRNASREELVKITTKVYYYNKTNICDICREEYEKEGKELTDKSILYPGNVKHETDKSGKKTEKSICRRHGNRACQRYDPNSGSNIKKSLALRRTGDLNNPEHILGDNCQKHACEWFGCEDLNKKNDNYGIGTPIDCSHIREGVYITIGGKLLDLSGKIPQIKGRHYNPVYGRWNTHVSEEHKKKFDILILYCISEDGHIIERIYIFPKDKIIDIIGITITRCPTDNIGRARIGIYEEYRVTGEEELKKANEIWSEIVKEEK